MSVNVLWLIIAVFVPLVLYYVMFKMTLAVDKHISHKKKIYLFLFSKKKTDEIPNDVKEDLKLFPTNTMIYYLIFLASGVVVFFVDFYYPIDLATFYIPTPTLIALIVNFFFLVTLSDVISKRFYVHEEWEKDMERYLFFDREKSAFFKKRSGLGFMLLSFLTLGVYVYIYLFLVNREYTNHVVFDYKNVKKMISESEEWKDV